VKHTIYEDPKTHRFAIVRLPEKFSDGDRLPIAPDTRWFDTHAAAVAALPALFDEDE
jgi:hypothetical protein